ncbi:hypothetical protein NDU88_007263 [Pleurodeles waltl]|uniref:Uncharacterized protein n=1 Tax=Pleurodeles waltl TaxID=8319 RepID=A0AAV7N1L8_PLEWA|nr:hypothetical protein NDU88_007263 [Pleurodeles waltl]
MLLRRLRYRRRPCGGLPEVLFSGSSEWGLVTWHSLPVGAPPPGSGVCREGRRLRSRLGVWNILAGHLCLPAVA